MVTKSVRVKYRRDGDGWSFDVLSADSLVYLGGGWSRGKRRDAQDDFEHQCREKGWIVCG